MDTSVFPSCPDTLEHGPMGHCPESHIDSGSMDTAAVEVVDLVKRYGATTAVTGLTFTARKGAVTALLGPNGAGKTSTIEICEGFRGADGGRVRVLGLDPVADAGSLKPRVGVMPQSGGVPTGARAGEWLRLMASFHARPISPDLLLERLGLTASAATPFRRLSGGQQQRLSLACAVVGRPELVFLDGPTAGLGPQARMATVDRPAAPQRPLHRGRIRRCRRTPRWATRDPSPHRRAPGAQRSCRGPARGPAGFLPHVRWPSSPRARHPRFAVLGTPCHCHRL